MQDLNETMLKEIESLIQNTNLLNEYNNLGFTINWDIKSRKLVIKYCNTNYEVSLINDENQTYWYLTPYNDSFFKTSTKNGINIILFAIKENQELYAMKGKNYE